MFLVKLSICAATVRSSRRLQRYMHRRIFPKKIRGNSAKKLPVRRDFFLRQVGHLLKEKSKINCIIMIIITITFLTSYISFPLRKLLRTVNQGFFRVPIALFKWNSRVLWTDIYSLFYSEGGKGGHVSQKIKQPFTNHEKYDFCTSCFTENKRERFEKPRLTATMEITMHEEKMP